MSVRRLWLIVGVIWLGLAISLDFPSGAVLAGFVACAVFAKLGFLAGRWGVYK